MFFQFAAAFIGTVSFMVLFGAQRQHYVWGGIIGMAGWAVYLAVDSIATAAWACMIASMVVIFLSRLMAVVKQCPAAVFLIAGIFPLVPGAGVYWTTYYLVTNERTMASLYGYDALKAAIAIVLGLVIVFEIPQSVFGKLAALPGIRKLSMF